MQQREAIKSLHAWVNSVADATWDHAGSIDLLGNEVTLLKGKMSAQEIQTTKAHSGAEKMIGCALVELKGIVDQLRGETTNTAAELATKTAQLEADLRTL